MKKLVFSLLSRVYTYQFGGKGTKKNTHECVFFDGNIAQMHFFANSTLQFLNLKSKILI